MTLAVENVSTLTNDGASSAPTIAVTTSGTNRIIVVEVFTDATSGAAPTVTSITGLTGFTKRTGLAFQPSGDFAANMEMWSAVVPAQQTGTTLTVNLSGTPNMVTLEAFAVSGANQTTPWDPNGSLPGPNDNLTGTGNTAQVTGISTTNSHSIVFGFFASPTVGYPSGVGSGYTGIHTTPNGAGAGWLSSASEYQIFSSAQSNIAVGFIGSLSAWGMIADAIQAAPPPPVPKSFAAVQGC